MGGVIISVYGFRGAEVRNILEFEDDFPDAAVVKLEQNCRSTETILEAAKRSSRTTRAGSASTCGRTWGKGRRSTSPELEDEHAEARFVAGEIEELIDQTGNHPRRDRGLLPDQRPQPGARGHPGPLRAPVPGDRRNEFYERAEIKDAIAYLQVLVNPADEISRAGDQLPAPRDRRHQPGQAPLLREHPLDGRSGRSHSNQSRPGPDPPRSSRSPASPS